ncbi:hypothetical protein DES40_1838 [Litorimonas taeanensis]|uniref:Uncharacterized protein n=1 Tax=Litorimonas taeanensis TaxID=568099 RepID=A0A420WDJ4_9PROT|nr:hypothetical protein [Litorimonas taeanensis]RKQ69058.1 hypothetical protein DES40_1838 [Litorimonas taeanensis]
MGDSTQQARAFMRNCQSALADLDGTNPADLPAEDLTKALTDVQSGAKLNHARAIYRAAQDTLNAVQTSQPVTHHLRTLTYLLAQYEEGLIELEGLELDVNRGETQESSDVIALTLSPDAQKDRAEDALKASIHLARPNEQPMLSTLLAFSKGEAKKEHKPHASTEAFSDTSSVEKQTLVKPTRLSEVASEIAMDAFISEIIQIGLSEARQRGITLSLSYDVAGFALSKLEAEKMRMRLEAWISRLVLHLSIHISPEELGHIDISVNGKNLQLTANAPAMAGIIMSAAPDTKLTSQSVDPITGNLVLSLSVNPIAQAEVSPKMPVDEGIGARLGALMEQPLMDEDSTLVLFESKRAV